MIPALQVLFAGPKCHGTGTTGIVYLLSFCNYYQWLHLVHRLNTFYKDLQFQLNYCSSMKVPRSINMILFQNAHIFLRHLRVPVIGTKGLSLREFQVRYLAIFLLFSLIDSFGQFWMGSLHQNIQVVNALVPQVSILCLTLFLLYINDLPDDFICSIAINGDDATVCSKCDQASDLWQQLELSSELEFDL